MQLYFDVSATRPATLSHQIPPVQNIVKFDGSEGEVASLEAAPGWSKKSGKSLEDLDFGSIASSKVPIATYSYFLCLPELLLLSK
jgi:hypothetical protein